jgi:hypothetical protein
MVEPANVCSASVLLRQAQDLLQHGMYDSAITLVRSAMSSCYTRYCVHPCQLCNGVVSHTYAAGAPPSSLQGLCTLPFARAHLMCCRACFSTSLARRFSQDAGRLAQLACRAAF